MDREVDIFSKPWSLGNGERMRLYHYRSIESALLEIENGTLHFASREELNDPMEGYVRVFWQGDRAAWEGLLRNYICSVYMAIEIYLLRGNEEMLRHKTLVIDLHGFDNVPVGQTLKEIGDAFLAEDEVQDLARYLGEKNVKVTAQELKLILYALHGKAFSLCIRCFQDHHLIQEDIAVDILKVHGKDIPPFPKEIWDSEQLDEKSRAVLIKIASEMFEDVRELRYVQFGMNNDLLLYGRLKPEAELSDDSKRMRQSEQRRNWMSVAVDFPGLYVSQLKDLIYPKSYVVCFSSENNNSSMWGNYADNHRGVCLIYDFDEKDGILLESKYGKLKCRARQVNYNGVPMERNFYETLGRLTYRQVLTWLTGVEGISRAFGCYDDKSGWRKSYWEIFDAKNYQKIPAWSHEKEYRIALSNEMYEYNDKASRNLRYDPKSFVGLIFEINTSEYDKKEIMSRLLDRTEELTDFSFYQAEYDDETQKISIRKKGLWSLRLQ